VPPTPKSLILDLLSTLPHGSMPVRALVAAGALFGLGENPLRVALARLVASGLVERDERGRYRLGVGAAGLNREIAGWCGIDADERPWSGRWLAVQAAPLPRAGRSARSRRDRALRLLGFRSLLPGLEVRPDNLRGGVARARARLVDLGLDARSVVHTAGDLPPDAEASARSLWPTSELEAGYRASGERLARSRERLEGAPVEVAMVETFLVGGGVIRQLVLDPRLPEEILPGEERRRLVRAMRDYDRFGRGRWSGFMRAAGVAGRRAPVHVHAAPSGALAAVRA
jgi:phenylacetic acid degradation operon negative regulatory protein